MEEDVVIFFGSIATAVSLVKLLRLLCRFLDVIFEPAKDKDGIVSSDKAFR